MEMIELKPFVEPLLAAWEQNNPTFNSIEDVESFLNVSSFPFFMTLDEIQKQRFIKTTFPFILSQALILEGKLPRYPAGTPGIAKISRIFVLKFLAAMFLGCFARKSENWPELDFRILLQSSTTEEIAKVKCIVHYFERCHASLPRGNLIFRKRVMDEAHMETRILEFYPNQPLVNVTIHEGSGFPSRTRSDGSIEKHTGTSPEGSPLRGASHVDFANKFLGGGILAGGAVQEEIKFATCPEACVGLFIFEAMNPFEAICISGLEQFSEVEGYARTLTFKGPYLDTSERCEDGSVKSHLIAIDALKYKQPTKEERLEAQIQTFMRELTKAIVGFSPPNDEILENFPTIATGNWGCGVFKGDVQLKFCIQWLAASIVERPLAYYHFQHPELISSLPSFISTLQQRKWTVAQLFTKMKTLNSFSPIFDQLLVEQ